MVPWLSGNDPFPPLERALAEPNGLLAAGASLDPARLLDAYRQGIFPWSSEGRSLLWWSPDPRMVLFVDEFRVSRSLRKRLRGGDFDVRFDTACEAVIEACAAPRADQDGTWITAGLSRPRVHIDNVVWHLDVGSSHPGAEIGPKGLAVR